MIIPTLYLIIAGQVALVMVFLIAYLIYTLVSEENRWEDYADKLKAKIRELQDYKDRFDVVTENLQKQVEISNDLQLTIDQFDAQLEVKDSKIAEQEYFISELQSTITELQNIIKDLEEKKQQLDESNLIVSELKTQLAILEDQGAQYPEQINELTVNIEQLETENSSLKVELNSAKESLVQYQTNSDHILNDNFNLIFEGKKPSDKQFEPLNNLKLRYQDEINNLKKGYLDQKSLIEDLESSIMNQINNPSQATEIDPDTITRLQQMISESNTVVEMLEGEIDTLQAEVSQLLAQNIALTEGSANADLNLSSDSNPIDDKDDELFADSSTNITVNVKDNNDTIIDTKPESDDVFFDMDAPEIANTTTESTTDVNPELEQLQMQLDSANKMAMAMMMTTGDQGNIINFARNSIQFETLEDLGKGILETVALFQVNGALQLRGEEQAPFNVSSYGKLSAPDSDKISIVEGTERFTQNEAELLIRFKALSLLIKDMPLADSDKMGRIKDNMAIALELACSKLSSIEAALKIKKNQKILNQMLKNTYETIQNVEQQFNEQNNITNQVVNSLLGIISNPAMTEGMDPIYKDVFTSIINDGKQKFDAIKESGVAIDGNFAELVKRLGSKVDE